MRGISSQLLPVQVAEAVYSATVQAMVNSMQHAGGHEVARSLTVVGGGPTETVSIRVDDSGVGFNDSDVRSLNLLAELILAAMKPEEENRLAEISQRVVAGEVEEAPAHAAHSVANAAPTAVSGDSENPVIDESEVAGPDVTPAMFREYGESPKPRLGLTILLLLATLALVSLKPCFFIRVASSS